MSDHKPTVFKMNPHLIEYFYVDHITFSNYQKSNSLHCDNVSEIPKNDLLVWKKEKFQKVVLCLARHKMSAFCWAVEERKIHLNVIDSDLPKRQTTDRSNMWRWDSIIIKKVCFWNSNTNVIVETFTDLKYF